MNTLYWSAMEVRRLALKAQRSNSPLYWVKDSGTYLMASNPDGRMPDCVYAVTEDGTVLREPEARDDMDAWSEIWELTREICGGDDFAEELDPKPFVNLPATARVVVMHVSPTHIDTTWSEKETKIVRTGIDAELKRRESDPDYDDRAGF